ncbi:MAG: HAD-IA family hydrolase [Rectinemataceae bacterium]
MYSSVVFDFGNVLCGVNRMAFSRAAAAHSRLGPGELDALLWGGRLERALETGEIDSHDYFEKVRSLAKLDPDYSYEAFASDFAKIIEPHPEGEEALRLAKRLGKRCFVLSNTSFIHAKCIFGNETLASLPELHILSYKIGVMKPDPEIWRALLRYSGLSAEECLYVDDVSEYCDTARKLGFGALCYDKNTQNLPKILADMLK